MESLLSKLVGSVVSVAWVIAGEERSTVGRLDAFDDTWLHLVHVTGYGGARVTMCIRLSEVVAIRTGF